MNAPAFLSGNLGNSTLSFVLFEGEKILSRGRSPAAGDVREAVRKFLERAAGVPAAVGYASVRGEGEGPLEEALRAETGLVPRRVGRDAPFGLDVRVKEPEKVGEDRLAAARGALLRWPREDLVLVDAGTAITVDAVLGTGAFLGGAIAPGLRLAARALREGTSLLPLVEPRRAEHPIGRDTREAIEAGLDFGWAGLVDGLVEAVRGAFAPGARAVATGGDAPFLMGRCRSLSVADPDLVHLGIRAILGG